jgi:hypothetical protein
MKFLFSFLAPLILVGCMSVYLKSQFHENRSEDYQKLFVGINMGEKFSPSVILFETAFRKQLKLDSANVIIGEQNIDPNAIDRFDPDLTLFLSYSGETTSWSQGGGTYNVFINIQLINRRESYQMWSGSITLENPGNSLDTAETNAIVYKILRDLRKHRINI